MRLFAVFAALCALTQTALAQTPECKSISDNPGSKIDSAKYVDTISAEDVLMNARLKNICRGC
jgi:hypothetical protein